MIQSKLKALIFSFLQTWPGLLASYLYRIGWEIRSTSRRFTSHIVAIVRSREFTNYSYLLSEDSRRELCALLSFLTGTPPIDVNRVLSEIETDKGLAAHVAHQTARSNRALSSDTAFKPGRILLHYGLIRLLKLPMVFEAGVDKGLGALVVNRALARNRAGGSEGHYLGAERRADRPAFLIESWPERVGEVRYADWRETYLSVAPGGITFLFWDASTDAEDFRFLEQHSDRLSPDAVIVSAWTTPAFFQVAESTGRACLIFHARSRAHWFEGSSLAIAFPKMIIDSKSK